MDQKKQPLVNGHVGYLDIRVKHQIKVIRLPFLFLKNSNGVASSDPIHQVIRSSKLILFISRERKTVKLLEFKDNIPLQSLMMCQTYA